MAGDADDAEDIANAINTSTLTNVSASVDSANRIVINALGGEFRIADTSGHLAEAGYATGTGATTNLYDVSR